MPKSFEDVVAEMYSISAALKFISESIECHASAGRPVDACGLAYITDLLGGQSSCTADACWAVCSELSAGNGDPGEP